MTMHIKLLTIYCLIYVGSFSALAADNHYESALQAFQQQKYDASYIHLKNALQDNPRNLPAKLLKGQILTRNGYYDEAIKEFRQALEYRIDINLIIQPLGNVLVFNHQYQDVIDLGKGFTLTDNNNFEWKMLSASAYSNLGKPLKARSEYDQALKLFPSNTRAINSLAYLDLSENDLSSAEKQTMKSLNIAPNDHRTWHLKGKISEANDNLLVAIQDYKTALKIEPEDPVIKRSLAYVLISNNEFDEAKLLAEEIIKQTPDDPFAMLLNSWVLSKDQQGDLASSILEKLSNKMSTVSQEQYNKQDSLLFVKGMTEYIQGKFEQARKTLGNYVDKNPEDINATNILAEIYISTGQNTAAMQLLERVSSDLTQHLNIALKLANLYLKNDKDFKADYLLTELRGVYPDNIKVVLLSSKALVARGKVEEAIKLIENNNQRNPENIGLLMARGFLYLQNGQFEDALKTADLLTKNDKRNVDYWNLKAAALLRLERYDDVQVAIDNVFAISPTHFAGRFNQAMLLKNTNRFVQAKTLLYILVAEQPRHSASQLQLAIVESESNDLLIAINRLENLTLLESKNRGAQILLLDLYLKAEQTDEALLLVKRLVKKAPLDKEFAIRKAEILIVNRDFVDAKVQLSKLYSLWLDNPEMLFRLSSMQQSVDDYEGANNSLLKALTYLPTNLALNLEYARLNLQLNENQIAQHVVNEMEKTYGKNPNILLLKGDISLSKQDFITAHTYYTEALTLEDEYQLPLIRLYELARRGVKEQDFLVLVQRLVAKQPDNNWRRKLLADHLMNQNKWQEAKLHYSKLIEKDRFINDYSILNNLANIYMSEDLSIALIHAEKALENAKTIPSVLDTHGWILVQMERYKEGLVSLRQAYAIKSNNPAIRYHIAYTLNKLGRVSEAKVELQQALSSNLIFNEREAAVKLLSSI
jgi:putative PEP-CTERM system TPR-repeat lipoprotein